MSTAGSGRETTAACIKPEVETNAMKAAIRPVATEASKFLGLIMFGSCGLTAVSLAFLPRGMLINITRAPAAGCGEKYFCFMLARVGRRAGQWGRKPFVKSGLAAEPSKARFCWNRKI